MDTSSIIGLELLGFGKQKGIKQSNLTFPYNEGYVTSSDVYAVTSKIAKGGKSIPWILTLERNGEKEEVTEGDLYDLIQNPNPDQTREEYVDMALLFLLLSGEVFQKPTVLIGFETVGKVELFNPQLTKVNTKKIGNSYKILSYQYMGNQEKIPVEKVDHLKYANPTIHGETSRRGLSPLVAGYLTLQGLNNNQEANAAILKNQGAAGILSNEGEAVLTDPERNLAQKALDKLLSGFQNSNFGKIIQSGSKVKYTRLGLDPTQLKIIESKLLKFRDLCAIYDVKSIIFNDPVNASFNNLINAEKSYWVNAAIPNTQLIVNMFNKGVVSKFNEKEFTDGKSKYKIVLDKSSIEVLQKDQRLEAQKDKVKMDAISTLLNMPITTEGKVELLVSEFGYSEENAKVIAEPQIVTDGGNTD